MLIVGLLAALLAGIGWVYALRGLDWLGGGPPIGDSLPLLQLSGRDAQPLERVVVAWLAAGLVAGIALSRLPRPRRAAAVGVIGLVLLLLAAQASFSATRNVSFGHAIFSHSPGLGPWLEAALFTVGSLLAPLAFAGERGGKRAFAWRLPEGVRRPDAWRLLARPHRRDQPSWASPAQSPRRAPLLRRVRELGLRRRKDGDTGEH
jgi:hypothetical protein